MTDMDLPWKKHFGITCSCGKACVTEIAREQAEIEEPTEILRTLSPEDRLACAEFYSEHRALGHDPQPNLVDIATMPQA